MSDLALSFQVALELIIGLDAEGNLVMEFNTLGMNRGSIDKNGKLTTAIFK